LGAKFANGIGGVMEGDVKVGVIRLQVEDTIALAPNENIEEGVQANVEVTSTTTYVCRIEIELQRTIDMIED
jgi:hypothetical protein